MLIQFKQLFGNYCAFFVVYLFSTNINLLKYASWCRYMPGTGCSGWLPRWLRLLVKAAFTVRWWNPRRDNEDVANRKIISWLFNVWSCVWPCLYSRSDVFSFTACCSYGVNQASLCSEHKSTTHFEKFPRSILHEVVIHHFLFTRVVCFLPELRIVGSNQ